MPRAITQDEIHVFDTILAKENLALVNTTMGGKEVAVIAMMHYADGAVGMEPLAVLVNDFIFDSLGRPEET
jgi:hypothetical protein